MPRPLLTTAAILLLATICASGLAGCGSSDEPAAAIDGAQLADEQAPPPASAVSALLGTLADVPEARDRLAYVAPAALAKVATPLSSQEISALVLGDAGARRLADARGVQTAAQLGPATILETGPGERRVVGASTGLRQTLSSTTPDRGVLAPETASALQSCLGEPAAQVMRGPEAVGPTSGVGVSLLDDQEQPSGPKLRVCAAPHYVRDLHMIEDRLHRRFDGAEVVEDEIGEREIVWAVVPVATLSRAELRDLLTGGDALLRIARG